ncbi:pentapeptide repeat-containing protein, partial [Euryarchaeota archaeon]|nr:pentapeptide repeat-containing protein [Euryarchaeota archaeon]
ALIELEHYRNLSISEIEFLKLEINKTIIDINYEIEQNQENMQIINDNNIYYSNLLSERDQQLIQLRGDLNEERDALNSKNSTISDLEYSLIEIQQLVSYWNNMYNESKISLSGSDLIGINLICYDYGLITMPPRQCQLNHAVLSGANLTGANMYNVNLSEANLFNANLNGVNMDYVNLDGARLHFADLTNARVINLLGCPIHLPTNWTCTANSLIGPFANLSNAILSNITAQSMYLNNIDFSNSSLIMADFYNSNMRHSNLSNANLTGAYFRNAHLAFADLSGADLSGADLSNTYLADVYWNDTTCPDGSNSDNNGNTCVNNL